MADNQLAAAPTQAPVPVAQARQQLVVHDDSQLAYMLDTAKFEHLYRVARVIAQASLLPPHLKGENQDVTVANCFRVVNQAMRWGMDPFGVVDATYAVKQKLGYEGKLVAAVVNTRAGLVGRLRVKYTGEGQSRTAIITGRFADEDEDRTIEITVSQAKTDNMMWTKDPDQKLWYSGVTKWARRHCPEVLLGVMDDDDLDRLKNEEPAPVPPNGRISLHQNGNGAPTDTGASATDAHKEEQEPPKQPDRQEPSATEDQVNMMKLETRRVGIAGTPAVDELARKTGAARYGSMTAGQAERFLAEIRDMPTAGATAPKARQYAEV